jgi:hypothetical protein
MEYTLTLKELISRPVIRNDQVCEFLNRMTDEEIEQWDKEVYAVLKEENVPEVFPDWNGAYLAKLIDREILFGLFQLKNDSTKAISTNN